MWPCAVFCFFFLLRSRRSVEREIFGFWYAAHCRMFGTFGKELRLVMCLSSCMPEYCWNGDRLSLFNVRCII